MALQQTTTNEKGAITVYHRIVKADLDFNKKEASLIVYSYAAESLRHLEKQDLANKNKYEQIVAKLDELISNPTEDNEQERIDLSNELNSLMPIMEVEQKHLTETGYQLPLDENFSISDAYNWLKGNIFTDSIDV